MSRLRHTSGIGRRCRDKDHITPTQELDLSISAMSRQRNIIGKFDMGYLGFVHVEGFV